MKKRLLLVITLLLCLTGTQAQSMQPVSWFAYATVISGNEAVINISASIQYPWHIYSTLQEGTGPVPTMFRFAASPDYKLLGKIIEVNEPIEKFDNTFGLPVLWFEDTAVFTQRVKLNAEATTIKFTVTYMACSDDTCLLPQDKVLTVDIKKNQ